MIRLSKSFIPEERSDFKIDAIYVPLPEPVKEEPIVSNRNVKISHTIFEETKLTFNMSNAVRLLFVNGEGIKFNTYCESTKLNDVEKDFCINEYKKVLDKI
jgi:hypothetical protein